MDGILSPDGESVLHESKWVEAILSPDGLTYYYEGNWYSLNEDISSTSAIKKIPRPEKSTHKPEPENSSQDYEDTSSEDTSSKKLVAGIIAVVLLWYVFDSGNILSHADLASMDCSVWIDDEFFDWSVNQEACQQTKSNAQAIVAGGLMAVAMCFVYILSLSGPPLTRP